MKIASSWGLSPDSQSVYLSTRLLAVSAQHAAKGSRNGTVSVRPSICLSVPVRSHAQQQIRCCRFAAVSRRAGDIEPPVHNIKRRMVRKVNKAITHTQNNCRPLVSTARWSTRRLHAGYLL